MRVGRFHKRSCSQADCRTSATTGGTIGQGVSLRVFTVCCGLGRFKSLRPLRRACNGHGKTVGRYFGLSTSVRRYQSDGEPAGRDRALLVGGSLSYTRWLWEVGRREDSAPTGPCVSCWISSHSGSNTALTRSKSPSKLVVGRPDGASAIRSKPASPRLRPSTEAPRSRPGQRPWQQG